MACQLLTQTMYYRKKWYDYTKNLDIPFITVCIWTGNNFFRHLPYHPKMATSAEKNNQQNLAALTIHIREKLCTRKAPQLRGKQKLRKMTCFVYVSVERPFWCGVTMRFFLDVDRYVSKQPGFVGFFSALVTILGWHAWCFKKILSDWQIK